MIRLLPWLGLAVLIIVGFYKWRKDLREQVKLDEEAIKRMKQQLAEEEG